MTDHHDLGWDPDDLPPEHLDLPADAPDPLGFDPAGGPVGDPGDDVGDGSSWAAELGAAPVGEPYEPYEPDLSDLGDLSEPDPGGGPGPGELPGAGTGELLQDWPVGADPDAAGETAPAEPFAGPLDGPLDGALPEPVDGFPWTDPDLLGGAPIGSPPDAAGPPGPPDPAGLAEYAGVELAPDADPWAVLAASDDPATNALARWWAPDPPPGDPSA